MVVLLILIKKITTFSFKKTEFDLSKYKTKTTVFPKIQELDTWNIFLCLYKLKFNQNFEIYKKFFFKMYIMKFYGDIS